MKVKELIEYLKTLDQDSRVFLQYDSFDWHEMEKEDIEHICMHDFEIGAKRVCAKKSDYKIEMG